MKKIYNYFILLAFLGMSQLVTGQFYDGFTGTGNIGGNCATVGATPDCASNGWLTHSGTVGTIDILPGSLSYTGLQASAGNKIFITGAATLTRDINASIAITGDVGYYSVIINVIDATNLSTTGFDYFMAFAATAGNAGVTSLGARLGAKASGTGFRFGVANNSGGTITYTDCGQDLVFGTSYLVVVKYDKIASPTLVSLWVNPTSLGAAEPAGSVTNSVGTGAFATFASVCIRNGYSTTILGGTPKAEIDEIRVGSTWASVTPVATDVAHVSNQQSYSVYPNPAKEYITIKNLDKVSRIDISTILGQVVNSYTNLPKDEVTLKLNNFNKGIYFMSLVEEGRVVKTLKFTKE